MSPNKATYQMLIVEDHEFTRIGLKYSFEGNERFQIVAEADNGVKAIEQTEKIRPDIILMDIGMPIMDGITATQQIKERFPETKVVILTSRQIGEEIHACLAAGADAYCLKDITTTRLLHVLDAILEDAVWLEPLIARQLACGLPSQPVKAEMARVEPGSPTPEGLTDREYAVLELIALGKSNKEIAASLNLSTHTIKIHVRSLIHKLAATDRTQAAVKAIQTGLIQAEQ